MRECDPVVYIVDDDELSRSLLQAILVKLNIAVELIDSAEAFLRLYNPMQPGCVLLDVRMPGMGGLELQRQLNLEGAVIPVIFVTAHADVPMAVQAMSEGAFDFLQHPITPDQLRARVREAIRVDAQSRARMRERAEIEQRFHSLSDRERAVLASLIAGKSNKVIAADLGLSPRTIELYRARIMEKTHCSSLAQLIRMSMEIGFQGIKSADTRHD